MSVNSCPLFADVFARLKGLGVVSPLGNGYSVVKVRLKEFKIPLTCLNWESKKSGFFSKKYFALHLFELGEPFLGGIFQKNFYPSTYLDKGYRNAHPFPLV